MFRSTTIVLSAVALTLALPLPAHAASSTATATFRGGSGNYLTTSGTDANLQVSGQVTLRQAAPSAAITASGSLTGLRANTTYVTVPYKDGVCLPAAGVSAFPSGSFTTDGTGSVVFTVSVNPTAISPAGVFDVAQTKSVSVRQVVLSPVNGGGVVGTPTVPNVAVPEACDRHPVVR
ncbi:hypothetical protein [uncultured Friedmanniella sp.]|uniref:hypothetical protein n=1 Tax=uncultured Friedmanniella sp. TaxID=335381 RepID=UPI0035CBD78C